MALQSRLDESACCKPIHQEAAAPENKEARTWRAWSVLMTPLFRQDLRTQLEGSAVVDFFFLGAGFFLLVEPSLGRLKKVCRLLSE